MTKSYGILFLLLEGTTVLFSRPHYASPGYRDESSRIPGDNRLVEEVNKYKYAMSAYWDKRSDGRLAKRAQGLQTRCSSLSSERARSSCWLNVGTFHPGEEKHQDSWRCIRVSDSCYVEDGAEVFCIAPIWKGDWLWINRRKWLPQIGAVQHWHRLSEGRRFHITFPMTTCQRVAGNTHSAVRVELMFSKASSNLWFWLF